ncbi:MAG: hypothetical protein K2K47_04075 [Duncaniella sp.]|nr:hypothetical protein [Duncaniella sp.]
MKQTIRLYLDAKLLTTDEVALKKVVGLLSELEDKGFLKESRIVFDSTQENEINDIFDRHMPLDHTPKSENK